MELVHPESNVAVSIKNNGRAKQTSFLTDSRRESFDALQAEMVAQVGRSFDAGLTAGRMQDEVCEIELASMLKLFFPQLGFGSGDVVLEPVATRDAPAHRFVMHTDEIGIIAYRDEPLSKIGHLVSVSERQTEFEVQVSAWSSPLAV